jgi:cytochrome c5
MVLAMAERLISPRNLLGASVFIRPMHRRTLWLIAAASLSACPGPAPVVDVLEPKVTRIEGAAASGTAPQKTAITSSAAPVALSVMGGSAAVGTASGLFLGTQATTLASVPVIASGSEPTSTGAVSTLARRANGGLLVAAKNGLFVDQSGNLLQSPLSQTLGAAQVLSLDAFGSGPSEELWLVTDSGAQHVAGGQLEDLALAGVSAPVEALVGADANAAIYATGGTAYLVELGGAAKATTLAKNLGKVSGFDRSDDGTVYLATEAGLLSRAKDGAVSLRTFAAAGENPLAVSAVSAAYGSLYAAAGGKLMLVDAAGPKSLLALGAVSARGLSTDSTGNVWMAEDGKLYRIETGGVTSYATDAKPFFVAHCASCHKTGAQGAPVIDWESYATAVQYGPRALIRLQAQGVAPMPPATAEVLTATDFAVITKWVGGGMKP